MYDNYLFVLIYGLFVCMHVRVQARSACHFLLCMQTKILHIHIMFPPPPPLWVGWGGVLPSAAMYRYNYMFVLIYVWGNFCLYWFMVCLYVCIYVSKQGRHVIVFVSAHNDTTCTHNVPAPPPCGWVGGVLPSAAMYRYNYMFLLIYVW